MHLQESSGPGQNSPRYEGKDTREAVNLPRHNSQYEGYQVNSNKANIQEPTPYLFRQ